MNKYVAAVVGAGFGDEGKGLTVDYLCRKHLGTKLVIRFNGGAQAGHTVKTRNGTRHVFSHFGAGGFAGASTMFSRFCYVNPFRYLEERAILETYRKNEPHLNLTFIADYRSYVTTPWDILLNQNLEKQRQNGSVGLGIGVTRYREQQKILRTDIGFLYRMDLQRRLQHLKHIRDAVRVMDFDNEGYQLDMGIMSEAERRFFNDDVIVEVFNEVLEEMFKTVTIGVPGTFNLTQDLIVFEGAQGLMLDPEYGINPHTTWSNCGVANVRTLCEELKLKLDEVVYVTRTYGTRHGVGPSYLDANTRLGYYEPNPIRMLEELEDHTNKPHPFQGTLRKFPLDIHQMSYLTQVDFSKLKGWDVKKSLMVTWAHLLKDEGMYGREGSLRDLRGDYLAIGETADTVKTSEEWRTQ